jgi:hypothetical protein
LASCSSAELVSASPNKNNIRHKTPKGEKFLEIKLNRLFVESSFGMVPWKFDEDRTFHSLVEHLVLLGATMIWSRENFQEYR